MDETTDPALVRAPQIASRSVFARYFSRIARLIGGASLALPLVALCADSTIPFQVQWHDMGGPNHITRLVIVNSEQWARFWEELRSDYAHPTSARSEAEAVPKVDFDRYAAVIAGSGKKPMGGFDISIEKITDSNEAIRVSVIETALGPNCAGTTTTISPIVGAVIPATKKIVVFDTVTKLNRCQ